MQTLSYFPQIHWFSFLSMRDLAECSAVCKSWLVYVNKAYAAEYQTVTGVPAPGEIEAAEACAQAASERSLLLAFNNGCWPNR